MVSIVRSRAANVVHKSRFSWADIVDDQIVIAGLFMTDLCMFPCSSDYFISYEAVGRSWADYSFVTA